MANIQIGIVKNGTTTLATDGKYCDRNVDINVNVPIPSGYIVPSGEKSINENGRHNVTEYASVNVNVPSSGGTPTEFTNLLDAPDLIESLNMRTNSSGAVVAQNGYITLEVNVSNMTAKTNMYFRGFHPVGYVNVHISTDGGTTWTTKSFYSGLMMDTAYGDRYFRINSTGVTGPARIRFCVCYNLTSTTGAVPSGTTLVGSGAIITCNEAIGNAGVV